MRRGSVLFYSGSVYHGGGANRSDCHPHRAQHHLQRGLAASGGEPVPLGAARGGRDAADRSAAAHGLRPRGLRARLHRRPARSDRGGAAGPRVNGVRRHHVRAVVAACIPCAISLCPLVTATVGAVPVEIEPATVDDHDDLFTAFSRIVSAGEGFPQRPPLTREEFDDYWMAHSSAVVGGLLRRVPDRRVLHQAELRGPGRPHRQRRLLRAGPVPGHRRRAGPWWSTRCARHAASASTPCSSTSSSSPTPPARMYRELGFDEVGRVPDAVDGEDAVIYWRSLEDIETVRTSAVSERGHGGAARRARRPSCASAGRRTTTSTPR